LHILEVTGENANGYAYEEFHFCDDCAKKYLYEETHGKSADKAAAVEETEEFAELNKKQCPDCGIKFKDFRVNGRLGCGKDYEVFRAELLPLLENIHGATQHEGKSPRRLPHANQRRDELAALRKLLQQAVNREDYEEAARLRDKIKTVEQVTG
jgi:protein arginine kinase activator